MGDSHVGGSAADRNSAGFPAPSKAGPVGIPRPRPRASIRLLNSQGVLAQFNDTAWSLEKTGAVQENAVVWAVTATRGVTSDNFVAADGFVTVQNPGAGPATIGNIVVNLQRKVGKTWVTASSDAADATVGDGATSGRVVSGASSEGANLFTENAASGPLSFTDASSNTVLGIPAGELLRVEVIVTFGNSGARGGSGASAQNVDINGNGTIDADEAWVRSVPTRLTLALPAPTACDDVVTLSDLPANVVATGTVSFADFATEIGGGAGMETISATTTRAVAVAVDAGELGGTVTNTAALTGEATTVLVGAYVFVCCPGLSISASDTETIGPEPAAFTGFAPGDFVTFTQGGWGAAPNGSNPGAVLASIFGTLYPSGLEAGISGAAGYSMRFTSASAVTNYLPQGGAAGALTADLVNPTSSSAKVFGGQVVALRLNVDFGNYLAGQGLAGAFGGLTHHEAGSCLDGLTVAQVLAAAETALGGGGLPDGYTFASLTAVVTNLNESFDNGNPTAWAQAQLTP